MTVPPEQLQNNKKKEKEPIYKKVTRLLIKSNIFVQKVVQGGLVKYQHRYLFFPVYIGQ